MSDARTPDATTGGVMILAGGTGGHIFPGLAVAHELRRRGVAVGWLGSAGGMETRLVPQHGIEVDEIAIRGVRGKGVATLLTAPFKLMSAVWDAGGVLAVRKPRAVISFGGFAAGPGGLAARLAGIPLLVHEQNRAPGMTNKVLSRLACHVLTGFPGSFPLREEVVGNPVRTEISEVEPPSTRLADRSGPLRLLVLGGSQGASALNRAVPLALASLGADARWIVRHQCGEKMLDDARAAYRDAGVEASVEPFIADMAAAYAWADLVVCRAGALTLAEVCAVGVASVLVPFPQAVDDHQTRNAQFLVERGAARLLPQSETLAARLADTLSMLSSREALRPMAEAARALAKPDAAARVADLVMQEMSLQNPNTERTA